jgi:hypothetical protein
LVRLPPRSEDLVLGVVVLVLARAGREAIRTAISRSLGADAA